MKRCDKTFCKVVGISKKVQPMDQRNRPENDIEINPSEVAGSHTSSKWHFFGRLMPRAEIVFFVQVILVYIVVIVSIANLTIGSADDKLWIALLSSSLGYILPSPSLKLNKP